MKIIKEETLRILGVLGFEIHVEYYSHYVKFVVSDINGVNPKTKEITQKNLYLKAEIKWDTCSHFWFGKDEADNPGYIHICGYNDFIRHSKLMEVLWSKAKEYFVSRPDRFTDEFEEWKWDEVIDYGKDNEFYDVDVNGEKRSKQHG